MLDNVSDNDNGFSNILNSLCNLIYTIFTNYDSKDKQKIPEKKNAHKVPAVTGCIGNCRTKISIRTQYSAPCIRAKNG